MCRSVRLTGSSASGTSALLVPASGLGRCQRLRQSETVVRAVAAVVMIVEGSALAVDWRGCASAVRRRRIRWLGRFAGPVVLATVRPHGRDRGGRGPAHACLSRRRRAPVLAEGAYVPD